MHNRMILSGAVLTLSILISSFCYTLMGFDAVGEPSFEKFIYELCLLSPVLPLAAMVWFVSEGNSAEECWVQLVVGHILGVATFFVWISLTVDDPAVLGVFPVFFIPIAMMLSVHLFVLCFALALGAGLAHVIRVIGRARRMGNR